MHFKKFMLIGACLAFLPAVAVRAQTEFPATLAGHALLPARSFVACLSGSRPTTLPMVATASLE